MTTRQEAIEIFTEAWEAKDAETRDTGVLPIAGTRVGAGIDALIAAGIIPKLKE